MLCYKEERSFLMNSKDDDIYTIIKILKTLCWSGLASGTLTAGLAGFNPAVLGLGITSAIKAIKGIMELENMDTRPLDNVKDFKELIIVLKNLL
jgi:hypothetical protein